jgi:hypothetical protein
MSLSTRPARSRTSRDRAGYLIRRATLREAGVTGSDYAHLTAAKYDVPLGVWLTESYLRGTLTVRDSALLDEDAPLLRAGMTRKFKQARRSDSGKLEVAADTNLDVSVIPPGADIEVQTQFTRMPVGVPEGEALPTIELSEPRRLKRDS